MVDPGSLGRTDQVSFKAGKEREFMWEQREHMELSLGRNSWVRTSGQANRGSVMGLGYRPAEGEVAEEPSSDKRKKPHIWRPRSSRRTSSTTISARETIHQGTTNQEVYRVHQLLLPDKNDQRADDEKLSAWPHTDKQGRTVQGCEDWGQPSL